MIDIHILPKKAQNELIDFYQFLVERYVGKEEKSSKITNTLTPQKKSNKNREAL